MIRNFNRRHLTDFIGARNMNKKIAGQLPSYVENPRNSAEEHRARINQE